VATKFSTDAPKFTEFLSKVAVPLPVMDKVMAHMEETEDEPADVAKWFLQNEGDIWSKWLPEDVAARVKAAL
jgi:glycine betaine/proline transport system substrate-binding protein